MEIINNSIKMNNKEINFEDWWFNNKGQDKATKRFSEQAENNIALNLNERVKELYGENSIGDESAENNVFWYEVERLAKENSMHLEM
jgi:hypothetical protein